MLLVAVTAQARAGELEYQFDYDYPELRSGQYGARYSPHDFWRDYGGLSAIATQQGVDYSESYLPELVAYRQGPPARRVRSSHSRYEFLFRFTRSCAESVSYPCAANLFEDRFETP